MAAAMETANAHHHHGHHHQPHGPLPASPTLTNPDMILPDYERSTSPDPDLNGTGRGHSPLMMWKNAHAAAASGADIHHMFAVTTPGEQRIDHPYGPTGPITPTTPIIYGNGTMLSDIGEVTEVESTPGKSPSRNRMAVRRPQSPMRGSGSDAALRSSPTMGIATIKSRANKNLNGGVRERRSSLESNSTITTEDHAAIFADFDDSVSVGDSVFQGDDEESMASSYVEGTAVPEPTRLGVSKPENPDRLSTYSTTSLSQRAEEILANAKKRLTTMEGNLTRARSSLHVTTPPYGSDASTPSPPFQRASTAMYSRDSTQSTPDHSPGHSRMSSDIAMRNGLPYRVAIPRSQSALGAAGGYRQPLAESKSADRNRSAQTADSSRTMRKSTGGHDSGLQPLTEDQVAQLEELSGATEAAMATNFLSPTFGTFAESAKGLQRSASAAQMRDIKGIKDQMKDLKGKISSLREQARVDSMKRRSLQSLRTPSPFTHSQIDQWYAEPPPGERDSAVDNSAAAQPRDPWNGEDSHAKETNESAEDRYTDGGDVSYHGVVEDATATQLRPAVVRPASAIFAPTEASPAALEKEETEGDEEEDIDVEERFETPSEMYEDDGSDGFRDAVDLGYESESGESLYHDTVQHMVSHEDREDAFDYEHFFLHSAMGTMRRDSLGSYTSEGSVETTRGPTRTDYVDGASENENEENPPRSPSIDRRLSTTSISTIDTFATAEEERSRRSIDTGRDVDAATEPMYEGQMSSHTSTGRPRSAGAAAISSHRSLTSIMAREGEDGIPSIPEECEDDGQGQPSSRRMSSAMRRPMSMTHRPSVASFDSTGTNRSFPLVNKAKTTTSNSTGVLTPNSSPDQELKTISDTLMTETAHAYELQQRGNGDDAATKPGMFSSAASTPQPLHTLLREDKYLVERVVAELGRCVLGLTESGRASTESRMYRRRIDAARRILEGLDEADR